VGWNEVTEQETALNSKLPFRTEAPFVVAALTPVQYQKQWWLQHGKLQQDECARLVDEFAF